MLLIQLILFFFKHILHQLPVISDVFEDLKELFKRPRVFNLLVFISEVVGSHLVVEVAHIILHPR